MNATPQTGIPQLSPEPAALIEAVLASDRRVLLVGPPGAGKSTLVDALGAALVQGGRVCYCLGADPGSPLFGVPGAVCLGRRDAAGWKTEAMEALCTLDAGRFRLPLVDALRRLVPGVGDGMLLVDGPGVVRGVCGAELLPAVVEASIRYWSWHARAGRCRWLRNCVPCRSRCLP
jgi:ribonuclease Z